MLMVATAPALHSLGPPLGRRNARGRVAYLLCELVWRLRAVGDSEEDAVRLPVTQTDLADALGLTPIYVNRILQEFRREQLITLEQRRLTLLDVEKLQGISGLTSDYLRPGTTPSGLMHYFEPAGILPQGFDRREGNPRCRLELSRDAGWVIGPPRDALGT